MKTNVQAELLQRLAIGSFLHQRWTANGWDFSISPSDEPEPAASVPVGRLGKRGLTISTVRSLVRTGRLRLVHDYALGYQVYKRIE